MGSPRVEAVISSTGTFVRAQGTMPSAMADMEPAPSLVTRSSFVFAFFFVFDSDVLFLDRRFVLDLLRLLHRYDSALYRLYIGTADGECRGGSATDHEGAS